MSEIHELETKKISVRDRLYISGACTLVLPYHVALDKAREKAMGRAAIGTTGRGIGPAYEDKIARRALKVHDLFNESQLKQKLTDILAYHNFMLVNYYQEPEIAFAPLYENLLKWRDELRAMVTDVTTKLHQHRRQQDV